MTYHTRLIMKTMVALFIACVSYLGTMAQKNHLFRVYEDNDFINILGKVTDKGYTDGFKLEYFFLKDHPSRFFIDKWLPKAGPRSINTFGYNISQIMIVPLDIAKPNPDKNDWPYAGSLTLSHILNSSNPEKKYALQTEIVGGVIGPLSLAKETQIFIHKLFDFTRPKGWQYQMPNDVLLNLNLMAERMLWQPAKNVEVIGGGQLKAGTMIDGAALHAMVRVGKMQPYFDGYINQFNATGNKRRRNFQYYFFARTAAQLWVYNALLDGGVFSGKGDYYSGKGSLGESPNAHKVTASIEAGVVAMIDNFSFSFIQKQLSTALDGVSGQTVGNISLTYSW